MIEIMNLRNTKPSQVYDVKVDRSSVLGNPFPMRAEWMRDEVCDKYNLWFLKQSKHQPKFIAELNLLLRVYKEHGRLRLFCWCAPKRCHAETIKAWLNAQLSYTVPQSSWLHPQWNEWEYGK